MFGIIYARKLHFISCHFRAIRIRGGWIILASCFSTLSVCNYWHSNLYRFKGHHSHYAVADHRKACISSASSVLEPPTRRKGLWPTLWLAVWEQYSIADYVSLQCMCAKFKVQDLWKSGAVLATPATPHLTAMYIRNIREMLESSKNGNCDHSIHCVEGPRTCIYMWVWLILVLMWLAF